MGLKPKQQSASEDRNLGNEYQDTVTAQGSVAPQLLQLSQQYGGAFTGQNSALQNQAFGAGIQGLAQYSPLLQQLYSQGQQQAIQGDPLYNKMYQDSLSQLSLGGQLNSDEQREATQGGLMGLASAGRANSNMGIFNQILNRSNYSTQRYQQRLGNAQSVYGMMPQATGFNTAANGLLGNSLNSVAGSATLNFNPESSYAQDLYNTNLNKNANFAIANNNARAGITGALIGLGGSILGGKK